MPSRGPLKPITQLVLHELEQARTELLALFKTNPDIEVVPMQQVVPSGTIKSMINYVSFEFYVGDPDFVVTDTIVEERVTKLLRTAEDLMLSARRDITAKILKKFPDEKRDWRLNIWTDNSNLIDEMGTTYVRRLVVSFALKVREVSLKPTYDPLVEQIKQIATASRIDGMQKVG